MLKKPNLRRCFNFLAHAKYDKYVSFLENFAPCISGFLSGIMFQGFCSVIRPGIFFMVLLIKMIRGMRVSPHPLS